MHILFFAVIARKNEANYHLINHKQTGWLYVP
jgi:hypothetical protein